MGAVQKSLRIPQGTVEEIERIARETGRDFSSIAKDLLAEAIKMRRCPGIVFADGVVAEEVHSQNPLEASAGVKVKVYYCYREV